MAAESIDLATSVAAVATLMTVACCWPQLRRVRRTGDVAGISLSTTTLSLAAEVGWLIYLSGEGLWSALPESALTIAVDLVLAVALLRAGSRSPVALAAGVVWGGMLVGSRVIGGPGAIAVLLSVTYAVQLVPSVWTAWRSWCPSGVAANSWTVRLTQSVLWGLYGGLRNDPPLVILGVIGSLASAGVLARLAVTRSRRSTVGSTVRVRDVVDISDVTRVSPVTPAIAA
jgi:uncharacterized protein with PQ loop repeat